MNRCIKCGSYAFNLYKDGIDQGGFCDVHYWQGRAHRAESLAEQPAQRKPLTDEDCTRIYNEANGITTKNPPITTERIFKAMRAAHGIKEKNT